MIFSVLVLCTQVNNYDVCYVTLSVYPHRASLKNMPGHGGNYIGIEGTRFCSEISLTRTDLTTYLVGSISTVAGHIFQARPVWIYTQSNITNIIFTWVHNTNTEKITLWFRVWMAWSKHAGMLRKLRKAREFTSRRRVILRAFLNSSNISKCLDQVIQTRKP
jgi:hypothetical protein